MCSSESAAVRGGAGAESQLHYQHLQPCGSRCGWGRLPCAHPCTHPRTHAARTHSPQPPAASHPPTPPPTWQQPPQEAALGEGQPSRGSLPGPPEVLRQVSCLQVGGGGGSGVAGGLAVSDTSCPNHPPPPNHHPSYTSQILAPTSPTPHPTESGSTHLEQAGGGHQVGAAVGQGEEEVAGAVQPAQSLCEVWVGVALGWVGVYGWVGGRAGQRRRCR